MNTFKINQIFIGEVASVQNYGAFVKIPGCPQQGLIHKTQISSAFIEDVGEVLNKGEKVWCKIISKADDGKIGLSMKYVNQGSGEDLDPNNVKLKLDEQKRKNYNPRENKKVIKLEAIFNTICSKCKTSGHLAKDCFSTPGGKKYELLPEEEEETVIKPETDNKNIDDNNKKHKTKKSKKRKKKHENTSSDNESDSSTEKAKKKKKKSKEHKKKKRKHHHNSSDDS